MFEKSGIYDKKDNDLEQSQLHNLLRKSKLQHSSKKKIREKSGDKENSKLGRRDSSKVQGVLKQPTKFIKESNLKKPTRFQQT